MITPELRQEIEKVHGNPIRYPRDCDALAMHIQEKSKTKISPSTIKRLYGFVKTDSNPTRYTLDVIAIYIGYADWDAIPDKLKQSTTVAEDDVDDFNVNVKSPVVNNNIRRIGVPFTIVVIVTILFVIWDINNPTTISTARNISYVTMENMPEVRTGMGIATQGDSIFVIGGCDAEFAKDNLWLFNASINTWETLESMPTSRAECGCAILGDKIYCFGGWRGNDSGATAVCEVYNLTNRTWTRRSDLPLPLISVWATIHDSLIYILGGTLAETGVHFFCYHPSTDIYDTLLAFSVPRIATANALINEQIIVAGGQSFAKGEYNFHDETDIYTLSTGEWKSGAKLPTKFSRSSACTYLGKVYISGGTDVIGEHIEGIKSNVWSLDSSGKKWDLLDTLSQPLCNHRMIGTKSGMLLLGGNLSFPNPIRSVLQLSLNH